MNNNQIGEVFIEQHILRPEQLEDILQEANLNGKSLVQIMVANGFVDKHRFYQTIADSLGMESVPLPAEIPPETLRLIPSGLARLHRALPLGVNEQGIIVALVDPFDLRAAEDLHFALGKDIYVVERSEAQLWQLQTSVSVVERQLHYPARA